jgi:hypothetical protein
MLSELTWEAGAAHAMSRESLSGEKFDGPQKNASCTSSLTYRVLVLVLDQDGSCNPNFIKLFLVQPLSQ